MNNFEEGLIPPRKNQVSCCEALFPFLFRKKIPSRESSPLETPMNDKNTSKKREISIQKPEILSHCNTIETMISRDVTIVKMDSRDSAEKKRNESSFEKNEKTNEKNVEKIANLFPTEKHPLEKYPLNTILWMETKDQKRWVLVKLTEKRFDVIKKKSNSITLNVPADYRQKIPCQQVLDYIASRLKTSLILDLSNGIGEYTVPLLKNCETVVSGFSSLNRAQKTSENIKKLGGDSSIANLISFPEASDFDIRGRFDMVFVNPYSFFPDFCSKSLNAEKTLGFLMKIKRKANNFVMVLHRNTDNLENLVDLLGVLARGQPKAGFEIQKIYYNEKLKFLFIFGGDVNNITIDEEVDAIQHAFISKCEKRRITELDFGVKLTATLTFLQKTLGNARVLSILKRAQDKLTENCDLYDTFKKIIKKTPTFQKSTSIVSMSGIRAFKPSVFNNVNPPPTQFLVEDSLEPSLSDRPYSLNEDFRRSEDELNEKRSNSSEEYYLSEYSINTSNEDSNDGHKKTQGTEPNNDDFEIIQANTFGEPKLSTRGRQLSFSELKEDLRKDFDKTKTFEEGRG